MQTFLPDESFVESLACLDYRRLCKQRLEALIIGRIVEGITPTSRWRNHPAVQMWMGYPFAIWYYYNCAIEEWVRRGYQNNMSKHLLDYRNIFPPWLGDKRFHTSHRERLLEKNFEHYSQFGWIEKPGLIYFWPTKNGY